MKKPHQGHHRAGNHGDATERLRRVAQVQMKLLVDALRDAVGIVDRMRERVGWHEGQGLPDRQPLPLLDGEEVKCLDEIRKLAGLK